MPVVNAPAESHIAQFAVEGNDLAVSFKEKEGGTSPTYVYHFRDAGEAARVGLELATSPHPFGQVLHPDVIQAGIPFTKTGRVG